jgi:RNA methyltransferase, TrmH family
MFKSQVKYIQSLSQKKLRDEEGVFVAEGPKIVHEMLTAPNVRLKQLFATKDWVSDNASIKQQYASEIIETDDQSLERVSLLKTPNKVTGIFFKPEFPSKPSFAGRLSIVLDTIQDPGNLGTIIRCADWFGIENIICSEHCVDNFNPKVIQASMGSVSRVRVLYEDLETFFDHHQSIYIYATALNGTDIMKMEKLDEGFIVVGNESKGIRENIFERSHQKITIPRFGKAESLNAAIATGIILSHVVRGRS